MRAHVYPVCRLCRCVDRGCGAVLSLSVVQSVDFVDMSMVAKVWGAWGLGEARLMGPSEVLAKRAIRTPLGRQCMGLGKGERLTVNGECKGKFSGSLWAAGSAGNSNRPIGLLRGFTKGAITC